MGLIIGGATPAGAQDMLSTDSTHRAGLSMADVLRVTTARNASIRIARSQVDAQRGVVMAARGAFDPIVQTGVDNAHDRELAALSDGTPITLASRNTAYSLGVPTQFRSGMLVTPQIDVTRKDVFAPAAAGGLRSSQATAQLNVLVPLSRNRSGVVTSSAERAAESDLAATTFSLRHAAALGVLQAAQAYWAYAAAVQQLEVYRSSEERAQRMVNETKQLVDAEERPPSDMQLVRANLSAKRVVRISAEQALVEARATLGSAMGVDDSVVASLPLPATAFPAVSAAGVKLDQHHWKEQASASRADLAAAVAGQRTAETLVRASASDLRSRMDVVVGLGYTGQATGSVGTATGGFPAFFSPLYSNVPGLNVTVGLRYELPSTNAGAVGRAEQRTALLEEQRIAVADLQRQIATSVSVALDGIRHGQDGLREAQNAVELSEGTVLNEQRRFRLGVGTLFDVIQAQDALTNALLGRISNALSYADALAALHFASGTLLRPSDGPTSFVADVDVLTMPPT